MAIEDIESCGSRTVESTVNHNTQQRQKLEVYNEVLRRLQDSNNAEVKLPGFDDQLWVHFNRLPPRYALDVNAERAEDVLTHKRLLNLAEDPANRPAFEVRLVQIYPTPYGNSVGSILSESFQDEVASSSNYHGRWGLHPPPTFGSSQNLDLLAFQDNTSHSHMEDGDSIHPKLRPMHEITFSTIDRPKLLSQLTSLLAEVGLNIQEAHAFSTVDGYSLDVFVVDGWEYEETEQLRKAIEQEILRTRASTSNEYSPAGVHGPSQPGKESLSDYVKIPNDGTDVWEIDARLLKFENKVASGSYGDLYRGTYHSQEVAIKVLKPERVNADMLSEFAQEVYIMRKVRHKNVVQLIGACTRAPNLCIVTEFMSRGSLHDFLHKQKGMFKLPTLLKVALDISKGMNYLHQNKIIHRDLKTANLLMDENEVVKVGDFGVARVQSQSGVMTAETGTYRWMAPEVIEHRPYDHKADVFSFGIVLWELLTREIPYSYLTPLQAAVGVVQKGLRPTIPKHTNPKVSQLLERCWQQDPNFRPNFSEIIEILQHISKEVRQHPRSRFGPSNDSIILSSRNLFKQVADEETGKDKSSGGFFAAFKRVHHY